MKRLIMMIMATVAIVSMTVMAVGYDNGEVPNARTSFVPAVSSRSVARPAMIEEEEIIPLEPESTPVDLYAMQRSEYPEATYLWEYLKDYGYNDYVCAGIIGNIMVEVGGFTLAIQPDLNSKTYAGMCQWALKYYPEAKGLTFEEQCIYLTDTIEKEFKTFSGIYRKGFNYEAFTNMTDCEQAALAFAKVYERCGSGTYSLRQQCAVDAYNYFVG